MSECILWTGSVGSGGYGLLHMGNREWKAHRIFYALYRGTIPRGHVVHHRCENKLCVNPDHLETLPIAEHVMRHGQIHTAQPIAAALRRARTHCKRGHAYSPENTINRKDGGRDCRACQRVRVSA